MAGMFSNAELPATVEIWKCTILPTAVGHSKVEIDDGIFSRLSSIFFSWKRKSEQLTLKL